MTQLLIIRHGETVQNSLHICQGQGFGELSPKGISQCEDAQKSLEDFDLIISSDLKRAKQTAKIISNGNYEIIFDERVRERGFGKLEGTVFPDPFNMFDSFEELEAESLEQITTRLNSFIKDIKQRYPNGKLLVVSHGMVIRVLLSIITGEDQTEIKLAGNCQINRVEI